MALIAKGELASLVAERAGLTTTDSARAIGAVLECIEQALRRGDSVRLTGFGTFRVTETKEHRGHDPRTLEPIVIPAGKRVLFSPGSQLRGSALADAGVCE